MLETLWYRPTRPPVLALALGLGLGMIILLSLLLPEGSTAARLLLDYPPANGYPFPYPLTIQNVMHLLLFLALGELYLRWRTAAAEQALVDRSPLPNDPRAVLLARQLGPIRERVRGGYSHEHGFLPRLIDLCILQFMVNRSVDQTISVLNNTMDLLHHRVDLRYNMLRYLVWVIPTVGFIGTVVGISLALALIDPGAEEQPLGDIAQALGVSFYTTLVALMESALLVLVLNLVQASEERALNSAGDETLTNLINRLISIDPSDPA